MSNDMEQKMQTLMDAPMTTESKPPAREWREWAANPNDLSTYRGALSFDDVHVIEHAAYDAVCAERDEYRQAAAAEAEEADKLRAELAELEAKISLLENPV